MSYQIWLLNLNFSRWDIRTYLGQVDYNPLAGEK